MPKKQLGHTWVLESSPLDDAAVTELLAVDDAEVKAATRHGREAGSPRMPSELKHTHEDRLGMVYVGYSSDMPGYHIWRCVGYEEKQCPVTTVVPCAVKLGKHSWCWCLVCKQVTIGATANE